MQQQTALKSLIIAVFWCGHFLNTEMKKLTNELGLNISTYKLTPLSDICHEEKNRKRHWREDQIGSYDSQLYQWRKKGQELWKCSPSYNHDNEIGLKAILVEGVICDDAFVALQQPHVFHFQSRTFELDCYPNYSDRPINETQFRFGLIMLTNQYDGYVAFPIIPSTTFRHIDLRHRRPRIPHTNPYLHHYAAISASQLTCQIEMKFVNLPHFTGQSVIFRSHEADSRNCGYTKPNGYDAISVIPFPIRQNRTENLRSMFNGMQGALKPFASSLRFFTASLRFHGVRAVVIEAGFLLADRIEPQSDMKKQPSNSTVRFQPIVYPLLASFFMQNIVVCIATFDRDATAIHSRQQLHNVGRLSVFVSPGSPKPSDLYNSLLGALSGPLSGNVLHQKTGKWIASLSGETKVYEPQSLVAMILDGLPDSTKKEGKKNKWLINQLKNGWREITLNHHNIPEEESDRPLLENEIIFITKTTAATHAIDCTECVILHGTGQTINLEELTVAMVNTPVEETK